METKMLQEFENLCLITRKAIDEKSPNQEFIERRLLHIRTFMLRCGIELKTIQDIESTHNL